ncbi:tRNA1(Val) (adenine(37)-N6)-methyltransferase [Endozoicomonas euniceicola]|uniref:tRNA1(Val) (adenine(37)-N6)-methyltransferase n=1 Tax=Endozoicomonas euniceicola TaxID=1234143 RepID=A0ABY6GY97_9GAMM|nr:methyltransferase [Endozoicomonas euniceicola]UYM16978.1 methyltransferase [Endozoicomonas euniceicola]
MARKSNPYFQFKQFRVNQGQCAMKVTLDACLFGALVDVEDSRRILDIGAGTGLLSLMAAQRSFAHIDAVELDSEAACQAQQNFDQSPWQQRLQVIHSAVQDLPAGTQYDTIICNPPFFENSLRAPDERRNIARHTDTLSFSQLAESINQLLENDGMAWVLLPTVSTPSFLREINSRTRLCLYSSTVIRSSEERNSHRNALAIKKLSQSQPYIASEKRVTIYDKDHRYTQQVTRLLEDYFLKL